VRVSDGGGTGYSIPGDPAAIRAAVAQLKAVASSLGHVQATARSSAGSVEGSWQGPAASAFQTTMASATTGLNTLASGATTAATALDRFASVLEQAQATVATASGMLDNAGTAYSGALRDAASLAHAAATKASDDALSAYNSAASRAGTLAATARHEVAVAARAAAAALAGVAGDVNRGSLHEVADALGGPGTALAVLGLEQQGVTWVKIEQAYKAVQGVDPAKFRAADPKEYQNFEDLTQDLDDGDMVGLKAYLTMQSTIAPKIIGGALSEAKNAAVPGTGDEPGLASEAGGNALLDTLGKVGIGLAVVGDVDTLFLNKDATGLDKGMAGANLAGMGAVAVGGEAATALGINAATDWIPVVGEVVIAGTAIYFAQEWARAHWQDIKAWSADAAHGIEDAATWTNDQLNHVNTVIDHTLATGAKDLVHLGGEASRDIVNAGSTVVHFGDNVAKSAVHDLNPMNW
jgi:uncharacterized protein YukE